ncbi:MAG: Fe-S cluster assembly protein SufD [Candidatus Zixiibacteriota bacterium]
MNHTALDTEITSIDQIKALKPELQRGPLWLREKRKCAAELFNATPLPPRGLHLWRYTDPAMFLFDQTKVVDGSFASADSRIEQDELPNIAKGHISAVVHDLGGRDITVHLSNDIAKQDVVVTSLSQAVQTHPELVQKHLYSLVDESNGKFEAMNSALWNDGIFIYLPRGVVIENPIHLFRRGGGAGSAQFPRLLVVADQGAEITVVDEYLGDGQGSQEDTAYFNGATEIIAGNDSRVQYVLLQRQDEGARSYHTYRALAGNNARVVTVMLSLGASLSKQNCGVILGGPGAESSMFGLLFGTGRQQFDSHTLHHHKSGNTRSDIDFKVVLGNRAMSAYTGLIRIDHDAACCEAYQENRNLLLNKGPRAETVPELEILNEEVSCSHGATVGPIDPEALFYLAARGIARQEAVRMIVSGFVASTLKQLPSDLRERVSTIVQKRMEAI